MANSDKNIRITTNNSTSLLPKIVFTGQSNSPIVLNVLDDNTLSFEGSSGQLFSINNVLSSGYIFAINDISGIPSFRINADGTVGIAEFTGNVGVGLTNPTFKFQTNGSAGFGASIWSSPSFASSISGVTFNNGAITSTGVLSSTGRLSVQVSDTAALAIKNAGGTSVFNVDTTNGITSVLSSTASTSTTTGSLVVAGGVGIGSSVNIGGRVGIGTNLLSGQLNIKTSLAATPGLVVQGAASQTADYAQFFTSTGTTSLSITKDAEIKFPLAQDIKLYATAYGSVGAIKTTGNIFAYGGLIFAYGVSDELSSVLSPTSLSVSGLNWSTYSSGSTIRWATNNPVRIQPTGTSVVPLHINLNNASWTSGNAFEIANNGDLRFSVDYTGSTRVLSTVGSGSTTTGALVVTGGVGIGGSLYVSSATAISGITINAGVITGSLTGTASTATYSHQSGYAITSGSSGLATTAAYSHQSGFASTSGSSGSATTANNINVVSATANSAHTLLFSPTSTGSGVAVSSNTTLSYNPSTNVLSTSGLAITSTTASTSTATGALQVAGGVGISGRLSFNQASFGTTGISTNPTMAMIGNTGDPIFMSVLEDNTISFEGSQGQLFSITPNLSTGYIYSVNDITGIPLLRANANANVTANEYAGNFGIGITNPGYKLHVVGSVGFTSTTASTSTSTGTLVVAGGVGIGGSLYVNTPSNISNVTLNNGVITGNLTGTATTAGFATTSGLATTATYSHQAGYAITASSATTATTASTVSVASAGNSNLAHPVLITNNPSSGSAVSSDSTFSFNPSTEILSVSGLAVTSTTGSSNTTTGALVVTGGVGIGGSFNVGNKSRFNDEVYINSLSNNALYSSGSGGVAYNWAVGGNLSSNKYFLGLDLGLHPVGGNQSVVQTFWGMQLVGNSGVVPSGYTASSVGTRDAIGVLVPNQQGSKVAFGIIANASQTADLQIWTSSTASTSSPYLAVKADGQIYSYVTTPATSFNSGALVVSGGVGIGGSLFVNGDLTINGTTTTINSVTLSVDDKNIELGSVGSPSDVTAEGGGITLKGATDKFINWYSGVGWSSSESWNLVSGSTFKINNTNVLSSTTLGTGVTNSSLTSVGTITSGTWAGTTITAHYGGIGLTTPFTVGDLVYANSSTTWARLPASSNSGYVLASAGSGATPVYTSASTITAGSATTAFNINVVLARSNANHSLLFSPSLGTASGAAVSNDSTLVFNPSTEILTVSGLAITSSAATTSSSSGALIVSGGVGIGGSVIVGGRVGIGTVPNLSMLNIQTASAGTTGLSISASASQSAPLFEWFAAAGGGRIRPSGEIHIGNETGFNMSSGAQALISMQGRGGTEGVAIRGFNSGATEVIFETQGNPGNQLFAIFGDGGVNAPRINVTNSTGSTSTASGALIVTGGVGIGGSLNVTSASSISGVTFNSGTITGTLSGYATTSNNLRISSAGSSNLSHSVLFSPNSSTSGSAVSSDSTFTFNSSTEILSVSGLAITNTTSSTSTTTGALKVSGGVGIAGTVNILGDETVNGKLYYSQSTVGTAASSVIPSIMFVGQNNNPITLSVLADNTLSFEGSSGQLFSINNNLSSGTIFSVNDISGIPILRANANGTLSLGEFSGSVGVGLSLPSYKFHVNGSSGFGGTVFISGNTFIASSTTSTSTSTGALVVSGGVGIGGSLYVASPSNISNVILNNGVITGNLTGTATTSTYSIQSGYAITAGSSNTSGFATTSGLATTASNVNVNAALTNANHYLIFSPNATGAGVALSSESTFVYNPSTDILSVSGLAVTSSLGSNSTTAGALVVTGGVGIGGSVNIGRQLTVSGTARINSSVFNNPPTSSIGASLVHSGYGLFGSYWTGYQVENGYLIYGRQVPGGSIIIEEPLTGTQVGGTGNVFAEALQHFKWGNDKYVVLASTGNSVLYSTSPVGAGSSWFYASLPTSASWQKLEYGNNRFIAIATGSTSAYSLDGINWTLSTLPGNYTWSDIKHGNGVFVAGTGSTVAYTYDGIEWTIASNNVASTFITFGNGLFFANSTSNTASYSRDGISWTNTTLPSDTHRASAYGNGVFVNVGNSTTSYFSTDLINWISGPGGSEANQIPAPWYINNLFYFKLTDGYSKVVTGPTGTLDFSPRYTGEINNVRIGAITPGAAEFTALAAVGPVRFVSGVASTNYKSGSVVISGGVGIGGSLNTSTSFTSSISGLNILNGSLSSSTGTIAATNKLRISVSDTSAFVVADGGNSAKLSVDTVAGIVTVSSSTASTSSTTGALIVTGGVGIGQTLFTSASHASSVSGVILNNGTITGTLSGYATTSNNVRVVGAGNSNLAHPVLFTPASSSSGSAVSSDNTFFFNSFTEILSVSGLAVTASTASTSSTTGALIVTGGVGVGGTITVGFGVSTPVLSAPNNLIIKPGVDSSNAIQFTRSSTAIPVVTFDTLNSRVGIGVTNPEYDLEVNGEISATTKSFLIPHPTKENMKLRYGSLEGPENGVYIRGELKNSNEILLPDYWEKLVDHSTITVHLTPIGNKTVFVKEIKSNKIIVGSRLFQKIHCFYSVWAERKDVPKLKVEF